MADDRFIWIEFDEDRILQRFDFFVGYHRHYVTNMLDDVADFGVRRLQAGVPQYTTYILRHIDRSQVRWIPGGGGGGGEWGTIVGIKAGSSKHPLYVEKGTGIYATPSRGYITPTSSKFMSFFSQIYGRRIRVREVKGQRPQLYFYSAWKDVAIYAKARLLAGNILP